MYIYIFIYIWINKLFSEENKATEHSSKLDIYI